MCLLLALSFPQQRSHEGKLEALEFALSFGGFYCLKGHDSSVVGVPDLPSKGCKFKSLAGAAEEFSVHS